MLSAIANNATNIAIRSTNSVIRNPLFGSTLQSTFKNIGGNRQPFSTNSIGVTVTFSSQSPKAILERINVAVQINHDPVGAFDKAVANLSEAEKTLVTVGLQREWTPDNQHVIEEILQARGGEKGQDFINEINNGKGTTS